MQQFLRQKIWNLIDTCTRSLRERLTKAFKSDTKGETYGKKVIKWWHVADEKLLKQLQILKRISIQIKKIYYMVIINRKMRLGHRGYIIEPISYSTQFSLIVVHGLIFVLVYLTAQPIV